MQAPVHAGTDCERRRRESHLLPIRLPQRRAECPMTGVLFSYSTVQLQQPENTQPSAAAARRRGDVICEDRILALIVLYRSQKQL